MVAAADEGVGPAEEFGNVKDCDFIPADYHAARTVRGAIKLRAGCVGTLIAIMVVWVVAHHHRVATAKAMLPDITRQQEQITIHLAKKAAMQAEQADLRDHQSLRELLEDQPSLVLVLSDLSRRMPDTVVLTEVSVDCPSLAQFATEIDPPKAQEPQPPGDRPPPSPSAPNTPKTKENPPPKARVTLKGIAVDNPDVVRFAAALETSPLFDRVQMEVRGSIVWAGRRAQLFELSCGLLEQQGGSR
ncbi:MAG TPA: PilN domain-containing protein [Phycisphaerae bacterium]|nr:PilN domain-containing protein [Phycisphaerae bacterium]